MRFSKKYFIFALALIILAHLKFNNFSDRYGLVRQFRGAEIKKEVFYPLMSKNINDTMDYFISVNGEDYTSKAEIVFSANMVPLASSDFIKSVLYGACYRTSEESAIMQVGNTMYEFTVGEINGIENGDDLVMLAAPVIYKKDIYISLPDLCKDLGYEYHYDKETHTVKLENVQRGELPSTFDLRNNNKLTTIRNQGNTATCWAYAAVEAMESRLLPFPKTSFSVDHMLNSVSRWDEADGKGGEYTMAVAYFLSWQGPVLENRDDVDYHLQEVVFLNSENITEIKWDVFRYGGVTSSVYIDPALSVGDKSAYYNKDRNAYYYDGSDDPNHEVVIIGWDDYYSKSNFKGEAPADGAFICQNSWGEEFGNKGVFYVSYYDSLIGNQGVSYVKVAPANNYDNIYQTDLCGWLGQVGYGMSEAYGANVYTAKSDEMLCAAGFYTVGQNTEYELYVVKDYTSVSSLSNAKKVAQGSINGSGYYTIDFENSVKVSQGERFAVILAINTLDSKKPLAVECDSENEYNGAIIVSDGVGYISPNGKDWSSVESSIKGNLCLKCYSREIVVE